VLHSTIKYVLLLQNNPFRLNTFLNIFPCPGVSLYLYYITNIKTINRISRSLKWFVKNHRHSLTPSTWPLNFSHCTGASPMTCHCLNCIMKPKEAMKSTSIPHASKKNVYIFMHVTLGTGPLYPLVTKPFEHGFMTLFKYQWLHFMLLW